MKIAVYYNLNFGGAKRVVFEQVKGLSQKGHDVDLYLITDERDIFDPIKYARNIYTYKYSNELISLNIFTRLQQDISIFTKLRNLHKKIASDIDRNKYDIALVHPDKFTQAPFILRFLKTTSIYYCQEPLRIAYEYSLRFNENVIFIKKIYEEISRLVKKSIDRVNTRSSSYTIASCYHIRERMIESYDVYPWVCYPGIDSNIFKPLKIKKVNQVVFIGDKNQYNDGYDLAYASLRLLSSKIRPRLKIISWKKNNNERLSDLDLVKIYNESLAVFCLSRLETFGLVPLEAMSCGIPVIATRVSGHRETIIENKTGYLVDFNPKEIAFFLSMLISNHDLAQKIGAKGRKWILKRWTWKKCNERLIEILEKISDKK